MKSKVCYIALVIKYNFLNCNVPFLSDRISAPPQFGVFFLDFSFDDIANVFN